MLMRAVFIASAIIFLVINFTVLYFRNFHFFTIFLLFTFAFWTLLFSFTVKRERNISFRYFSFICSSIFIFIFLQCFFYTQRMELNDFINIPTIQWFDLFISLLFLVILITQEMTYKVALAGNIFMSLKFYSNSFIICKWLLFPLFIISNFLLVFLYDISFFHLISLFIYFFIIPEFFTFFYLVNQKYLTIPANAKLQIAYFVLCASLYGISIILYICFLKNHISRALESDLFFVSIWLVLGLIKMGFIVLFDDVRHKNSSAEK
ncbi:MAG: hypothetical protein BWY31_03021 [Lentisphaerae bacterium ADurb.Bin242]|nr:MAG: hypothetical protein BWY31_03021 [Lentisphaerae bacterium ADurb.Bin242]